MDDPSRPIAPTTDPIAWQATDEIRRTTPQRDPGRSIASDVLERILGLATLAPSSFNLQPWRFLVVRDERSRRRLQTCARNQPQVGQSPVVVIVLGYHHPVRTHLEPMLTMELESGGCTPEKAAEIRGRATASLERQTDHALWATRSTMLATSALMLAAESFGVASTLVEGFDSDAVRKEFGIADDHTICCLIALGYAVEAKPFSGRFGLDEVCYSEHFGQPWKA